MKYIRTKDGLWLFGGTHNKGKIIIGKKHEIDFGFCFDKKDIISQADTIEELCDEFVIKVDNEYLHSKYYPVDKTFYIYNTDEEVSLSECLRYEYEIYGAIWTDKGLIYVAKMNEKGELELL